MHSITADSVAQVVREVIPRLACALSCDVMTALQDAREHERAPLGRFALEMLCENARIAECEHVPLCQDTGSVHVCLEIGPDTCVAGDVFSQVDAAVAAAYTACGLRKSLVCDALLNRANTSDNTPAFCELRTSVQPGARLSVMLKGGGSDNASRVVMLPPGSGRAGIVEAVCACVREKAANACPPLVIGVGIGATFDKVPGLAKRALLREVGSRNAQQHVAEFEDELRASVNAMGVGAGGMGGAATALAVHVETAPCHIAALPVAINMGCNSLRRITFDLDTNDMWYAHGNKVNGCQAAQGMDLAVDLSAFNPKRLTLPFNPDELACLHAGEVCLISGPAYTLRDAGHERLLSEMDANGKPDMLPYGLTGQTIFYAGPTPAPANKSLPFGAIGPTTASRMDFAAPRLYRAGIAATVGKGRRSAEVRTACAEANAVYLTTVGGAAALLARCVESSETIAYEDLGTEALRRVMLRDFPVVVSIDSRGDSLYD